MNFFKRCIRYFLSTLIYTIISLLVVAAIVLSLARITLPVIENYKPNIEAWISDYIGQQVEIATLDAVWYGVEPQLVLKGVQLLSQDRMSVHGYFQDARLGLNLLASLIEGRLVPGAFTVEGARFGMLRHEDGQISIQGIITETSAKKESNRFLEEWIFNQRILDVKNSEVLWTDLKENKPPRLFHNVNLRFINKGDRHLIQGSVDLPSQIGSSINIIVDAKGNLLSANRWDGRLFVETSGLQVKEVLEPELKGKLLIQDGAISAHLWSDWKKGQLVRAQGDFGIANLTLASPQQARQNVSISNIKSNYAAFKKENVWQISLNDLVVNSGGRLWPASTINMKYDIESDALAARAGYLRLEDVLSWVTLPYEVDKQLVSKIRELNLQGEVKNASLTLDDGAFYITGDVRKFSNQSLDFIPGFESIDARISLSNNAASIELPQQNFVMAYPRVFKASSAISNFSGTMYFHKSENSWKLSLPDSRLNFKGTGIAGSLSLTNDEHTESPLLDLAFYLDNGSLSDIQYYIPEKIMKPKTVAWMESALKQGKLTHAVITHYGEVRDYPYRNNDGLFSVDVGVNNGVLEFAKQWPEITDIDGIFHLTSRSLKFFANKGESVGNLLNNVIVDFPDFYADGHHLYINGKIVGDTSHKLTYLHESPLETMFAKHIKPMKLRGESTLDLTLDIPLDNTKQTTVKGALSLSENQLNADEWKLDLTSLNGNLTFSEKQITAPLLTAKYFDNPVNTKIETILQDEDKWILINAMGRFSHEVIQKGASIYLGNPGWTRFINGTSELMTTLSIPFHLRETSGNKIKLQLSSALNGMRVDLPDPLGKAMDEQRSFALDMDLSSESRELAIVYGDYNALLQIAAREKSFVVERGGIGLQQTAVLPQEHGFRFSGLVPRFYWSEWEPILFPKDKEASLFAKGGGGSLYFDVNIADAEFFRKRFENVSLHASQTVQYWSMHITGPQLQGNVNIPLDITNAPLILNLDKLYIKDETTAEKSEPINPEKLSALNFKIKDLKYKEIALGEVELQTRKIENGQQIEKMQVRSPGAIVNATGHWLNQPDSEKKTELDVKLKADNLGKALNAWNFKDVMEGGKGKINVKSTWTGSPADFAFDTLNGSIDIDLQDASMLDFDVGAAKLFSILLPRRLLLDFRDVAQGGMYFDSIKGVYKIENGAAFTNSLKLRGPIADMELAGKIGLVSRTFDKVVTVNRRLLGDSIPLVGLISVGEPIVGGGLFVFRKLFEKQIDDILSVQYTIEGSWASPVITPVGKTPPRKNAPGDILSE